MLFRSEGARAGGPGAALEALGVAYVRFTLEHATDYRVMFSPDVADKTCFPELRAVADEAFGVLERTVVACRDAGLLGEADAGFVAIAAWSLVHGFASLVLDRQIAGDGHPGFDAIATAARLSKLLYVGAAARPTGAG